MKCEKSKRLDFAEWVVGDTNDFLNLTLAETELVELKVKLALLDKEQIRISSIPESNIPKKMGSCQSRIFNIESGTTSVSIDLIVRVLLTIALRILVRTLVVCQA